MQRLLWALPTVLATGLALWLGTAKSSLGGWFWVLFLVDLLLVLFANVVSDVRPWTSREAYGILLGVIAAAKLPPDKVRICVYKPVWWSKNYLKQITPYAPSGEWASKLRCQSATKGAVGRAYRTKSNTIAVFPNDTERIESCIKAFGYSEKEATNLKPGRTGMGAYPVKGKNDKVTHVIYFDTSIENISAQHLQGTISRKLQRAARELPGV